MRMIAAAVLVMLASVASSETVSERSVLAHEQALAGDALRGRGSATPDEAAAAAYVARQFALAGLKPAPGLTTDLQTARIVRTRVTAPVRLTIDGQLVDGVTVLGAGLPRVEGNVTLLARTGEVAPAEVSVAPWATTDVRAAFAAARKAGARLLIVPQSDETAAIAARGGPWVSERLEGVASPPDRVVLAVPAKVMTRLVRANGKRILFDMPGIARETAVTTNAIGFLPGRDPDADILLLSAHLDHLGVRADGVIMHGANDDASGTVAVIELAKALAAGGPLRRGVLFVCYGAEEIGGYGSRYFAAHPPVPLTRIAANIEFEMIGAQDPKLAKGALMMTGYERSDLGAILTAHGASIARDPYPDQHFFERSDNYSLAKAGVVAHTLSGWAVPPTYHQPTDTIDRLDIPFMARAIGSLVEPLRRLANADARPRWATGGKP